MNDLKIRAQNGEKILGTMLMNLSNPDIPTIFKVCGFDLFVIDSEHGYMDYSSIAAMISVAKAEGICVIVRIPEVRREVVLKYMEMGADGLLLPNVQTKEQAEKLVEYSKYAPLGDRGVALLKAHAGYKAQNASEYMKKANEDTILMVQIESGIGVANIDDIIGVEGIDVAFIGPNDLSQSLGIMGQFEHEEFINAIDKIIASAKAHGKVCGMHMGNIPPLLKWHEKGMNFNLFSNETAMILSSSKDAIFKYKD
jgi:2-dehydro-3-deoxyglucarate aldolase/4-hydroxy-2-oxoheptanedioate aldolase